MDTAISAGQFADPIKEFDGVVVITVPHMDDEVLACGGTIAQLPQKDRIHLIYSTDGSRSPAPPFPWLGSVPPDLISVRKHEAERALAVLGIPRRNLHFLEFPDGKLKCHLQELSQSLAEFFHKLKPSVILMPFRYDRHPDHLAVNRAAIQALQRQPLPVDLVEYFVYYRWSLLPGNDLRRFIRPDQLVQVDIHMQASKKRQALECYTSQTTLFSAWQDRPVIPPQRVLEVSRSPECFLRYDPQFCGSAVFTHAANWIRLVHVAEPFLKEQKERAGALVRLGRHRSRQRANLGKAMKSWAKIADSNGSVGAADEPADRETKRAGDDRSPLTAHCAPIPNRPIRVVVFGGGPVLERGIKQFLSHLEEHPDIELVGAVCQSAAQNFPALVIDLWRRRRFLAVPVLFVQGVGEISRFLKGPRREIELRRKLAKLSDRLHFVPDIHADAVLDRVGSLTPDLGLIYGSPILKRKLFEIPRFGTLGIHHGKVPEYRGKKTTFWAMYNGEETAGVTIQKINAGLDTGDVVKAGEVSIAGKSYGKVWHDLEKLGLALYIEAILDVKRGKANVRPQEGKKGQLYRDPRFGDIVRFWWRQSKTRLLPKASRGDANP